MRSTDLLPLLAERARANADPVGFRRAVLEMLAGLVGFDSAIQVPSRPDAGCVVALNKEQFVHRVGLYARDPGRYLPGLARGRAVALAHGAYVDNDVYSARERSRLPFYTEIVAPQGVSSQLVVYTSLGGAPPEVLFLCRHGRATPRFRDAELARVRALVPGLALAFAALPARVAPGSSQPPRGRAPEPPASLTAREREIQAYVRRGLRNADIALVLGTSPNTVRNQLRAIFEKTCVASRTELAMLDVPEPEPEPEPADARAPAGPPCARPGAAARDPRVSLANGDRRGVHQGR